MLKLLRDVGGVRNFVEFGLLRIVTCIGSSPEPMTRRPLGDALADAFPQRPSDE